MHVGIREKAKRTVASIPGWKCIHHKWTAVLQMSGFHFPLKPQLPFHFNFCQPSRFNAVDSFCYSVWDDDDMAAQATALQLCPFSIAPFVITRFSFLTFFLFHFFSGMKFAFFYFFLLGCFQTVNCFSHLVLL